MKLYRAARRVMLTHISSQIRIFIFRAFCWISLPLQKNIYVGMLLSNENLGSKFKGIWSETIIKECL